MKTIVPPQHLKAVEIPDFNGGTRTVTVKVSSVATLVRAVGYVHQKTEQPSGERQSPPLPKRAKGARRA